MHIPFAFLGTGAVLSVPMPDFDPSGGSYPTGFFPMNVTITIQAPATKFRYTINDVNIDLTHGTLVNDTSQVVAVSNNDELRAIAIDDGDHVSGIMVASYDHNTTGGGGGPPHQP